MEATKLEPSPGTEHIIRLYGSPWKLVWSMPFWVKFLFFRGIAKVLWNPERTEGIFEAVDAVLNRTDDQSKVFREFLDKLLEDPEVKAAAEAKYLEPEVDLDFLRTLPDGTLGKEYWRHLNDNNLDPVFYPALEVDNDTRWFSMRARQIHDIFHVVLGFGTSVADELGVQAFTLGQLTDPAAAMIIGGGLLQAGLKTPWTVPECMEAIVRGYEMGKRSKSMIARPFSEEWARPLADIRRDLGIDIA